jgi:hypothetical protein
VQGVLLRASVFAVALFLRDALLGSKAFHSNPSAAVPQIDAMHDARHRKVTQ